MRVAASLLIAITLTTAGCSEDKPAEKASTNVTAWKAGDAVVVMVADVKRGPNGDPADYGSLMKRPGVIAVWSKGNTLRLSMSRQAMLVDMAALKLELERTPGLSNVREIVVPPT